MQQLIFIGKPEILGDIHAALSACLLTEEEMPKVLGQHYNSRILLVIGLSYFKLNKLKLSSELATSDSDEWKCISEQRKADMIELKNVCKRFKEHDALKDLNLKVESGEVYGLLGANGAGKSTTLNLILGFSATRQWQHSSCTFN